MFYVGQISPNELDFWFLGSTKGNMLGQNLIYICVLLRHRSCRASPQCELTCSLWYRGGGSREIGAGGPLQCSKWFTTCFIRREDLTYQVVGKGFPWQLWDLAFTYITHLTYYAACQVLSAPYIVHCSFTIGASLVRKWSAHQKRFFCLISNNSWLFETQTKSAVTSYFVSYKALSCKYILRFWQVKEQLDADFDLRFLIILLFTLAVCVIIIILEGGF